MSQSLADHVWPTQGLQHEIQAICYPTERRSAFLLPILWQNWGVELRSVLIKHPNCWRFANPPGSFYGVAFHRIGIRSAAPLNHTAQNDPDGSGRIEFAAILSNNIPWMSLPQGLREEGRRDGEKSDKKNLTPKRLTFRIYLPLFPRHTRAHVCPFSIWRAHANSHELSLPVFLSYVWRFNSTQAWHARPPQPYSTLENQSLPCRRVSKGPTERAPLPACWVEAFKCHW